MYREFSKVMIVIFLGWIGLIALLALLSRVGSGGGPERSEPAVPVYEGAYEFRERRAENLGWHNLVYRVAEEYPSLDVYRFYDAELQARGWKREHPTKTSPIWNPRRTAYTRYWVARAQWRDTKGLYRIQLELMSEEKLSKDSSGEVISARREPGILVSCTASRVLLPVMK